MEPVPVRHSIRLKNYDYSQAGVYFITICTEERFCYFSKYPELNEIVTEQWNGLVKRYSNIKEELLRAYCQK